MSLGIARLPQGGEDEVPLASVKQESYHQSSPTAFPKTFRGPCFTGALRRVN